MTTRERVMRAGGRLRAVRSAAAVATGLSVTLVVLAFGAAVDATVGLPLALRAWIAPSALGVGGMAVWWRARRTASPCG